MVTSFDFLFTLKKQFKDLSANLVIIPTYKEKENIVKMIRTVMALPVSFDVLIVDDNSPDGTAQLVKDEQKNFPDRLHLVERSGKLGLGTAYIAGFRWGIKNNYDYIFEMDCDFSHNPQDLVRLQAVLVNGADITVGSRYTKGGKVENWPKDRIALSYGASLYTRMITFMPVKDPTAGFVGYRREVLEAIELDKIRFIGYAFQIEMKFAGYQLGFKITEVPITFTDRIEGVSKMSKGIIKEAIFGVLTMRLRGMMGYYRNKNKVNTTATSSTQSSIAKE